MAIPEFTQYGLLPQGVHECTIPEAQAFLCSNEHRAIIWAGLQNFLNWAQGLPSPDAFLIDGSYVTDKALPNDVDVIVDTTLCTPADQQIWVEAWAEHHEHAKNAFSVDFWPVVIGVGNDFSAFFQYVRVEEALRRGIPPAVRKGLIRVSQ